MNTKYTKNIQNITYNVDLLINKDLSIIDLLIKKVIFLRNKLAELRCPPIVKAENQLQFFVSTG